MQSEQIISNIAAYTNGSMESDFDMWYDSLYDCCMGECIRLLASCQKNVMGEGKPRTEYSKELLGYVIWKSKPDYLSHVRHSRLDAIEHSIVSGSKYEYMRLFMQVATTYDETEVCDIAFWLLAIQLYKEQDERFTF